MFVTPSYLFGVTFFKGSFATAQRIEKSDAENSDSEA